MSEIESSEELAKKLKEELEWVKYRISMLDIIEAKLIELRKRAEFASENALSKAEKVAIQAHINDLVLQINALDNENRKEIEL